MGRNLHHAPALDDLAETPIRTALHRPEGGELFDRTMMARFEALRYPPSAHGQGGTAMAHEAIRGIIAQGEELPLWLLPQEPLAERVNVEDPAGAAVAYDLVSAALVQARQNGEIWNPVLDALTHSRRSGSSYHYSGTQPFWSENTLAAVHERTPAQPLLPSPQRWLSMAAPWIREQDPDAIIDALGERIPGVWMGALATHAGRMTPRLAALLLQRGDLLREASQRADLTVVDLETMLTVAMGPVLAQGWLATPTLDTLSSVLTLAGTIARRTGRIPEPWRAQAHAALADPAAPPRAVARWLLAADPSTPVELLEPVLATLSPGSNSEGAALCMHPGMVARHLADIKQRRKDRYGDNWSGMMMRQTIVAEEAMIDLVEHVTRKDSNNRRDGGVIANVVEHPSMTPAALRLVAERAGDMDAVRLALAAHPVARQIPEIRGMLMRCRVAPIMAALITDASPAEFQTFWDRLARHDPKMALELVEQGDIPDGQQVDPRSMVTLLKQGNRDLSLRVMRISQRLQAPPPEIRARRRGR